MARNVNEDPVSGWFSVSYGTCLSSGTIGTSDVEEPYPIVSVGEAQFTYGCYYKGVSQFVSFFSLIFFYLSSKVIPFSRSFVNF